MSQGPDRIRVLCLTTLPTIGAGNRLRVEQYAPLLRDEGIELVISPFFDDATYAVLYERGHAIRKALGVVRGLLRRLRDILRIGRFDLVLVYRESAPLGPPVIERLLRRARVPYVFDFDDAIFLGPMHPSNRRWAWLRRPARVDAAVRGATAVIAGNEYLAAWARRLNPNVSVIATPIDTDRHQTATTRRDGPLVIGWVGSSTTAPYLHLLDSVLDEVGTRSDLVVRVIGGRYAHPRARVECWPYRLDKEPEDVATFDVGVLPEPDDPWTRGKGAFKALVYMAAGIPVVASDVGVNPEVVIDGVTGYCVSDAPSWVSALERLAADPELRTRMGSAGRRRAEEHHSLHVKAPLLADVLRRAAAR
ncbi:MAG: glycosyltransferase family 4 protein [Elusimicrobia bacterium]|nr:glycosyltransferase family 4 protein [Elusimicrobiota bacterium]